MLISRLHLFEISFSARNHGKVGKSLHCDGRRERRRTDCCPCTSLTSKQNGNSGRNTIEVYGIYFLGGRGGKPLRSKCRNEDLPTLSLLLVPSTSPWSFIYLLIWPHLSHADPRPGIEPIPQQWQHVILSHQATRECLRGVVFCFVLFIYLFCLFCLF